MAANCRQPCVQPAHEIITAYVNPSCGLTTLFGAARYSRQSFGTTSGGSSPSTFECTVNEKYASMKYVISMFVG
jgi:hypothetical protein